MKTESKIDVLRRVLGHRVTSWKKGYDRLGLVRISYIGYRDGDIALEGTFATDHGYHRASAIRFTDEEQTELNAVFG